MHEQSRFSWLTAFAIVLVALVSTNHLQAQFNDVQPFNGVVGSEFAVTAAVPYWSVDGSCSPGMIFKDGYRGDNGSKCLSPKVPLGVGTRMVFDLNPGAGSSTISEIGNVAIDTIGRVFLSADDGSGTTGQELYSVLGAYYAITSLQADINTGALSSTPTNLFQHLPGGQRELYFSADDGTNGQELWLCYMDKDLSLTTTMLADINPTGSSNPGEFGAANDGIEGVVVFAASDGTNGRELWKTLLDTDGNPSSATLLYNINSGSASSDPQNMTILEKSSTDLSFFTADDGVNGRELWRTDGSVSGTGMVKDVDSAATSSNPANLTATTMPISGSPTPALMFTANSDGVNGSELWVTDGGILGANTKKIHDPGAAGSPANVTAVHDRYVALYTVGNTLYRIYILGWSSGYYYNAVKTFASPPSNLVAVGLDTVYFAADDGTGKGVELWKAVVDAGGNVATSLVKDIQTGAASSNPQNLTVVGGPFALAADTLYFTADDGANGRELWGSDGTSGGTAMIKDIYPGAGSSNPANLTAHEQLYLFFTADDGTNGRELWQSDGSDTPHGGMSYKWDLSDDIDDRGDPTKIAVAGTDSNVFSVYWLMDFPAMGGVEGVSEAAHQVNLYVELTDGADRAPLNVSYTDCGDGNVTRPTAPLTDGSNHNAIAFGMLAVLDQNPCDTDTSIAPNSPSVPVAYVPAVYDGSDWIPMTLTNFPAGVPTNPGTTQVMGELESGAYISSGWPAGIVAATENPWQQKRFAWARIDVWDDYIAVFWGNHQYGKIWVATLERQYKGCFKSLYLGNSACLEPAYAYYLDTLALNGGIFTTTCEPFGACCHGNGTCEDGLTSAECDGTYTTWMTCSDPALPPCCPELWADADDDDDVDHEDFGLWQACFSGDGTAAATDCKCYDRDDSTGELGGDGDVDLTDFAWFEACFGGPAMDPLPGCIP